MNKKQTIFIISNEPWGDIWFSKQHYANELSTLGYHVFFINPPGKWRFYNVFSFALEKQKINKKLTIINYKNNFPAKFFSTLNDFLNLIKIKSLIKREETILWQFDHLRFIKPQKVLKGIKRIYHVADPYMKAPNNAKIALSSDLIVCTSDLYVDFYKKMGINNVLHIPHGVSSSEFEIKENTVQKIKAKFGQFVLLIGTINKDVNIDLLEAILQKGYNLIILGKPIKQVANEFYEMINDYPNCHYIGTVKATELKHYVKASTVCITAYRFDLHKKKSLGAGTPLKILNYLAQRKPIITSIDSGIENDSDLGIFQATNVTNFYEILEDIYKNGYLPNVEAIDSYLKKISYPSLINKIMRAL